MTGSIVASGLGKRFNRYASDRPNTLKHMMLRGWRHMQPVESFWAVRGIDFTLAPGSILGIVGHNGSGKSTLLRLLGEVLRPDEGSMKVSGRVSGLLELNAGMHPELSGRENLFIGGVIAGLSYNEVARKFDEILAFAELEDFIDSPVRTYSAGMKLRLGFAAAVHGPPGVLLIDEVLSVGDGAFQAKCLKRIRQYKDDGAAIVVVTHDLHQMTDICDRAMWLKRGRIMEQGASDLVASSYRLDMARHMLAQASSSATDRLTPTGVVLRFGENRFGSVEQEILSVRLLDPRGKEIEKIESGTPLHVEVICTGGRCDKELTITVTIGTSRQDHIVNLYHPAGEPFTAEDGTHIRKAVLEIDRLDLAAGAYLVSAGLYDRSWRETFDLHWRCYDLKVTAPVHGDGVVLPPHHWTVGSAADVRSSTLDNEAMQPESLRRAVGRHP